MVDSIVARTAGEGFQDALWALRAYRHEEDTRNGKVFSIPGPFMMTLTNPLNRVVSCPIRDANPFFHVMEVVWMMAGACHTEWLRQFNKRIDEYANDGMINGAYGARWRYTWGDQIREVIDALNANTNTRQAVIAMWDPDQDMWPHWRDRPCNTHIYFRFIDGRLDMTVCNRSNDVVWGMFGANIVHMTYLHELIARKTGLPLGHYRVFTNNLHFYQDVYPNGQEIWNNAVHFVSPNCNIPIIGNQGLDDFRAECWDFMTDPEAGFENRWLQDVALPMREAYLCRNYEDGMNHAENIEDIAWKINAMEWLERHRGQHRNR